MTPLGLILLFFLGVCNVSGGVGNSGKGDEGKPPPSTQNRRTSSTTSSQRTSTIARSRSQVGGQQPVTPGTYQARDGTTIVGQPLNIAQQRPRTPRNSRSRRPASSRLHDHILQQRLSQGTNNKAPLQVKSTRVETQSGRGHPSGLTWVGGVDPITGDRKKPVSTPGKGMGRTGWSKPMKDYAGDPYKVQSRRAKDKKRHAKLIESQATSLAEPRKSEALARAKWFRSDAEDWEKNTRITIKGPRGRLQYAVRDPVHEPAHEGSEGQASEDTKSISTKSVSTQSASAYNPPDTSHPLEADVSSQLRQGTGQIGTSHHDQHHETDPFLAMSPDKLMHHLTKNPAEYGQLGDSLKGLRYDFGYDTRPPPQMRLGSPPTQQSVPGSELNVIRPPASGGILAPPVQQAPRLTNPLRPPIVPLNQEVGDWIWQQQRGSRQNSRGSSLQSSQNFYKGLLEE